MATRTTAARTTTARRTNNRTNSNTNAASTAKTNTTVTLTLDMNSITNMQSNAKTNSNNNSNSTTRTAKASTARTQPPKPRMQPQGQGGQGQGRPPAGSGGGGGMNHGNRGGAPPQRPQGNGRPQQAPRNNQNGSGYVPPNPWAARPRAAHMAQGAPRRDSGGNYSQALVPRADMSMLALGMVQKNSTLCPSDNQQLIDQTGFWSSDGIDWDAHRIGWLIAGVCAAVTVVLTIINVGFHSTHYTNRGEQRQIIRILYMPAVYAIISFFSYRYFRSYTYYDLIETAQIASDRCCRAGRGELFGGSADQQTPRLPRNLFHRRPGTDGQILLRAGLSKASVTLSAFLLLLIEFVAATAVEHNVENAIIRKDKEALPMPFCCWRYRPTKAYFMYTLKWSVLQYVILRPLLSIAGIVCEYYGVLCESGPWSFKTAHAYITVIDGVSITIALYGLLIFYGLTKDELKGRKPLSKFLSIKLIVMFTFYQGLVFDALEGRVIKPTQYWTETNIADGLNALAICIEMVLFSAFMIYAYSWREYVVPGRPRSSIWRPLWDSINYSDFAHEIAGSLRFFVDYARGKPGTHGPRVDVTDSATGKTHAKMDFGEAFGVAPRPTVYPMSTSASSAVAAPRSGSWRGEPPRPRESYDENVRLAPYAYEGGNTSGGIAGVGAGGRGGGGSVPYAARQSLDSGSTETGRYYSGAVAQ
ncbi:hypothetical protein VTO73DRAFT_7618 [Trametes versicolor]